MKIIVYFFALLIVLPGCSPKVAFNNSIKEKYALNEADVKRIQFYTSDDIVLYKSASESGAKTSKGELVVSSKTEEDRIIIKKGTPGVVIKIQDNNTLLVSFETDDKTLLFQSKSDLGEYRLVFETNDSGRGKLKYGQDDYYLAGGSQHTYLIFKIKKLTKNKSTDKVVGGRKIDK